MRAANVPARVTGLLPIVVIGLMVNAASVFYIMFMQGLWAPTLVNAVVCAVYSFAAHKVNAEVMRWDPRGRALASRFVFEMSGPYGGSACYPMRRARRPRMLESHARRRRHRAAQAFPYRRGAEMSVLFIEYPKCTTCKRAKKWLDEHGVEYGDRHIVEENPTAAELKSWAERSGLPPRRFFNTSGMKYRELGIKAKLNAGMPDDEAFDLLATDGMLVRRPLVIGDDFVLVGFKEPAWEEALL